MKKRERNQGGLEKQVMEVLWGSKNALTSQQILDLINTGATDLALTTILTVLSRLTDKGMVRRDPGQGRSNLFSATETRESFSAGLMLKLLGETGNPNLTFAQFTKSLSPEQLQALRDSLEK